MLKEQKIKKSLDKHWRSIKEHILNYSNDQNESELHALRVEIKKIKAILFLIEKCTHQELNSYYLPSIKKIYKQAGMIRTAHLHLNLMKKHRLAHLAFKKEQETIIKRESAKFCNAVESYRQNIEASKTSIQHSLQDIEDKKIVHLYKKILRKIQNSFSKNLKSKELHDCRKKIKILLNIHKILSPAQLKKLPINLTYLDKLQESIGKWNDVVTAYHLLSTKKISKPNLEKLEKEVQKKLVIIEKQIDQFDLAWM